MLNRNCTITGTILAAFLVAACGGTEPQPGQLNTRGKAESAGQFCGGFAGLPCPAGYECKLDGDYPDAGGTCVEVSKPDACWGAWLDQSGNCRTPSDGVYPAECCAGQFCGGIAGLPCPEGYECKLDGDYPDAGGTCVEQQPEPQTCHVGGCSGQYCSAIPGLISTCEWLPHYACYHLSQCGAFGEGGTCGWKQTPEFLQCMASQGGF